MATDALNWTSEGVFGGAYHKVIRWAFEKQGEYQTPLVTNGSAADGTITAAGDPPDVDVYIDDGRAGEYPFQHVHWHTTTIWNRRAADGMRRAPGAASWARPTTPTSRSRTAARSRRRTSSVYGYHTQARRGAELAGRLRGVRRPPRSTSARVNANNTRGEDRRAVRVDAQHQRLRARLHADGRQGRRATPRTSTTSPPARRSPSGGWCRTTTTSASAT